MPKDLKSLKADLASDSLHDGIKASLGRIKVTRYPRIPHFRLQKKRNDALLQKTSDNNIKNLISKLHAINENKKENLTTNFKIRKNQVKSRERDSYR